MTSTWRRIVALIAAAPMALIGNAFAAAGKANPSLDAAWAQTIQQNTLEGYARFVMDYPDSPHADQALAKLANGNGAMKIGADGAMSRDLSLVSAPDLVPSSIMVV